MQLNEDKTRVLLSAFQLEGAAADWWSTVKESRGASTLTWDAFKERFRDYFFPQSLRDAKLDEFLNLTQGPMSVLDYGRKFTSLAKYAKELVSTERTKCRRFEKGLRPAVRDRIVPLGLNEYEVLVDQAMAVEKNLADTRAQNEARQGKAPQQESRPTKRQRENLHGAQTQQFQQGTIAPSQSAVIGVPTQNPIICHNCRQPGHRQFNCPFKRGPGGSESRAEVKVCYTCGQPGHVQRYCPQRQGNGSAMRPPQPTQSVQSNRPAGSQSVQTQFQRGTQSGAQQY